MAYNQNKNAKSSKKQSKYSNMSDCKNTQASVGTDMNDCSNSSGEMSSHRKSSRKSPYSDCK